MNSCVVFILKQRIGSIGR